MKLFFILLLRFNFFLTKFLVKITHLLIICICVYYVREREGKEQINCNEGNGEMLYFLPLCFFSQKTEATVSYNKMIRCVLLHNFSSPSLSVAVWTY